MVLLFKIWKFPKLSETFIVNQIVLAVELRFDVKILIGELEKEEIANFLEIFKQHNLLNKIIIEELNIPDNKSKKIFEIIRLGFLNFRILPKVFQFYFLSSRWDSFPFFQFFYYLNFTRNIDVFHIQYGTNKNPIDILKKIGLIKGKVIANFHGHDLHFPINGKIKNRGYYKILFEEVEDLVVNTIYLRNILLSLEAPREKIRIIPVAVDTNFFTPFPKNEIEVNIIKLITVGRLEFLKGQIIGVEIVKNLLERGHCVEYTIIGDGKESQNIKDKITSYGLEKNIFLVGSKSSLNVRDYLRKSDIFLMTSRTDPNSGSESQGLVVAEAQACGLPIVAFDSGGVRYTFQDKESGFLVKEGDLMQYLLRVEELIKNPERRRSMGTNARIFVEKRFSKIVIKKEWEKVYRSAGIGN